MTAFAGRVLAIDYGTKRVGLAVTDPMQIIAQGAGTLDNDDRLIDNVAAYVREHQIVRVVVGMPFAPDGGTGAKGREIEAFLNLLRPAVEAEVTIWDESFSSVRAHQALRDGGMKRKKRREKGLVDEMAARLMLQEYLESNHHR